MHTVPSHLSTPSTQIDVEVLNIDPSKFPIDIATTHLCLDPDLLLFQVELLEAPSQERGADALFLVIWVDVQAIPD